MFKGTMTLTRVGSKKRLLQNTFIAVIYTSHVTFFTFKLNYKLCELLWTVVNSCENLITLRIKFSSFMGHIHTVSMRSSSTWKSLLTNGTTNTSSDGKDKVCCISEFELQPDIKMHKQWWQLKQKHILLHITMAYNL